MKKNRIVGIVLVVGALLTLGRSYTKTEASSEQLVAKELVSIYHSGGECLSLAVRPQEDVAYLGCASSLLVLDISKPESPVLLGKIEIQHKIEQVTISPKGTRLAVRYYFKGQQHVLNMYSLANPLNPLENGGIYQEKNLDDIEWLDEEAFALGEGAYGVNIYFPMGMSMSSSHWGEFGPIVTDIEYDVTHKVLFVARNDGIYAVDVSNIARPATLKKLDDYGYGKVNVGDTALVLTNGARTNGIPMPAKIIDLETLQGLGQVPNGYAATTHAGIVYIASEKGLEAAQLDGTHVIGQSHLYELDYGRALFMTKSGRFMFFVSAALGLRVLNMTDFTEPVVVGTVLSIGSSNAATEDGTVIVGDYGIYKLHTKDEGVAFTPSPKLVKVIWNDPTYLACSPQGGVFVFNRDVQKLGVIELPGACADMVKIGKTLFVASDEGVMRINLLDDKVTKMTTGAVVRVAIDPGRRLLFAVKATGWLTTYSVQDNGDLEELSTVDLEIPTQCNDLIVKDTFLLGLAGGVFIVNLADPKAPVLGGNLTEPDERADSMAIIGDYLVIAADRPVIYSMTRFPRLGQLSDGAAPRVPEQPFTKLAVEGGQLVGHHGKRGETYYEVRDVEGPVLVVLKVVLLPYAARWAR